MNDILYLISETITQDAIGNDISSATSTRIFCGLKSVSKDEFYKAAATGLRADVQFVINSLDYNGQDRATFENKNYDIYRTYKRKDGYTELYAREARR
jgi:SPP1 family predicted phage head-tail adaptor